MTNFMTPRVSENENVVVLQYVPHMTSTYDDIWTGVTIKD